MVSTQAKLEKIPSDLLERLAQDRDDQQQFAQQMNDLLVAMELIPDVNPDGDRGDQADDDAQSEENQDSDSDAESASPDSDQESADDLSLIHI